MFTVNFGAEADAEQLIFSLENENDVLAADGIAEQIRLEKGVIKGCISKLGKIVVRVQKCKNNEHYKFVNFEASLG